MVNPTSVEDKLKHLNNLTRTGRQAAALAFIDQNENDDAFLRAVKLQASLLAGFEQGRKDMLDIFKRLTSDPN